jgi:hypothetical protein
MDKLLSENFNFLIILLFISILLLISALFVVLVYLLLRDRKSQQAQASSDSDPKKSKLKVDLEALKAQQSSVFCHNHADKSGVGSCGICEHVYCEGCLKEWEHLRFCPEHFQTYTNNKWTHITNVKTTPEETENAVPIYQFKKNIWESEDIPTFIETDYKINVEGDFVESYVKLYVREKDKQKLSDRLKDLKAH